MNTLLRRHPVVAGLITVVLVFAVVWVVKLTQVARSVGAYAEYWDQPRGDAGGLLYVALGDSAAQGIGASSPERGYVGLLADRLREETGGPVQLINLSKSGARIRDVLDTQLPALQALARPADVVTVAVGGNDVRVYDRATFASEAARLAAALPAGAYVADAPYFMHGRWERDAARAAAVLRRAAEQNGLRPVALHDALRAEGSRAMVTQFAADWFHPNDRGHRVWADAFWSRMAGNARGQDADAGRR